MPELRHLRYFVAVAEELNFSRAAQRLHMAQPPLSVAIRQLEEEMGVELFERTTREVKLTAAGRAALAGAYRTLAEVERTLADARRAAAGAAGSLRVGFSWSARFETLPAIGQAFRASHPDVELLTQEMWNARVGPALRSGSIDVAVVLCPEIESGLSYETIRSEPVVAILAVAHPLARAPSVALRELADERLLLFPRDLAPRLYDTFVGLVRNAGFEPTIGAVSFHTRWGLGTLDGSAGVGLAPASVGRDVPSGLVAVPVSKPPDRLETALVWRADDTEPATAAFLQTARAAFERPLSTPGL